MRFGRIVAMAAGLWCAAAAVMAAPAPVSPKLVVVISIDQFSLNLYRTYRASYTGGLKRLSDGLVFTGYQSHGATETCPGHSTLLTGQHPSKTGIVANNWYDRATGSNLYCVSQTGTADPTAKTSALLKVDTLGDWLRRSEAGARVYSVSGKDRAAIMMAGHNPTGVFWWDDGLGFNTSSYAGPADPATRAPIERFNKALFADWSAKAPTLWPTDLAGVCKDRQKAFTVGETRWTDTVPPETNTDVETGEGWMTSSAFAGELRASPLFDRTVLQMATALADQYRLGQGTGHDLLAVSLSATDHIGHRFGSGGAQMCTQMAALDAGLGAFFTHLDQSGAPYVVVLAADHGGIDVPERLNTPEHLGPPARRIDPGVTLKDLSTFLRKTVGLAYDPLVSSDPRQLVLGLGPADEPRRAEITRAVVDWLNKRPEISHAYSAAEIAAAVPSKGKPVEELTQAERFNESFDPARSGDIIVAWPERATVGVPGSPWDTVAGHGSPWDYDRQVPILVWWPGVTGKDQPQSMETVDIAPTLAPLLGVTAPKDLDGRCIDLGQGCPR